MNPIKRKVFGELKHFARQSRLKKLKDGSAPQPAPVEVKITVARGPLDDLEDDELDKLGEKKGDESEA